ncbi:MAG: class I SAM-dependent methyltransferase [Flavobacterium sp.]|uniref:class I SAM-dependent methyltransferase n=1 Tax=Flavobacterium sp. TaxID=239 RepID=UPI001217C3CC|nr:class I SAM-dependent methyltransferase [Flavobacterium sp.]RZJ65810.1 MAG: class I SAM-dependent methyltransferase [Flavobacterium sp.]
MKDNFSAQAVSYAQFRPGYPDALIDYITSFVPEKDIALDLATGNGQVAKKLAPHFKKVFATDISEKQLENAAQADNIVYKKEPAEHTSFEDNTFNLITVAQAVHWFDFSVFYKEAYRILKPDGVFAALGYGLFSTNERTDKILRHYYYDIVGPYWDAERKHIDARYRTIPFPFKEIETVDWSESFVWTFEQLTGYLETWSATQHYKKKTGINPVDLIRHELSLVWPTTNMKVTFPLLLRIGRPFTKF